MGTGNSNVDDISTSIVPTATPEVSLGPSRTSGRSQGAMSQQGNSHGYDCIPQTLLRLVGYRDPTGRPQSWDRLRSTQKQGERVE